MQSNHASLKDLRIKYNSLASLGKERSEEELLVNENTVKSELRTCQDLLRKEKLRVKELTDENNLYVIKCGELENHIRSLTSIITDKDSLVNRLWDEVLALKKRGAVNEKEVLNKIDVENEVSAEGEIGEPSNSVGKSMISAFAPSFMKKRQLEIDEMKKLRKELQDSQTNNRMLNERMKELTEIYSKLEIEAQELRETLKFQKENSVFLTQQVLKINSEKETSLVDAYVANDELVKKLEISGIEKRKLESQLNLACEELKEDLDKEKLTNKNLKGEVHILKEEIEELKAEIRECIKIIKQKETEIRSLSFEVEEGKFKSTKMNAVRPDLTFLISENTELKSKICELKMELRSSSSNPFHCFGVEDNFRYNSVTHKNLIEAFGPDSEIFFEKFKKILKGKKMKIRNLKQQVESLMEELNKKPKEVEYFYSNYTTNTHQNELPNKNSENPLDSSLIYYNVERIKMDLEKQKIAKRKARAEKEQAKEDLAHAILEISDISTELLQYKLKIDDNDYLAFLVTEAKMIESCLLNRS